jgi:hypothetical protein
MKFQLADGAAQCPKTPLYFCACGEIGPHIPQTRASPVGTTRRFFNSRMTAASF